MGKALHQFPVFILLCDSEVGVKAEADCDVTGGGDFRTESSDRISERLPMSLILKRRLLVGLDSNSVRNSDRRFPRWQRRHRRPRRQRRVDRPGHSPWAWGGGGAQCQKLVRRRVHNVLFSGLVTHPPFSDFHSRRRWNWKGYTQRVSRCSCDTKLLLMRRTPHLVKNVESFSFCYLHNFLGHTT